MNTSKLAIFASGRGSNAKAILDQEAEYPYSVELIVVSKKEALAIDIAKEYDRPYLVLDKQAFQESDQLIEVLKQYDIDTICLAGFLWKIPLYLIQAYRNKIVNIHPSLLPKYGGKGMYGLKVHEAVVANSETFSGITIHLVNEEYDKGKVLFQEKIRLAENENAESLSKRILALEHRYFPKVIAELNAN